MLFSLEWEVCQPLQLSPATETSGSLWDVGHTADQNTQMMMTGAILSPTHPLPAAFFPLHNHKNKKHHTRDSPFHHHFTSRPPGNTHSCALLWNVPGRSHRLSKEAIGRSQHIPKKHPPRPHITASRGSGGSITPPRWCPAFSCRPPWWLETGGS